MKKSVILLICMNTFSAMGYSIVAPLFPVLGKDFSISEALLGWIISTYAIANCITTPFIPKLCKKYSRIKLLYFATFFEATCTLLYSFLQKIPSLTLFLIIVFTLRVINGIFSSFIITLVYSLVCSLSSVGGYKLPFLLLGLFLYTSVYLTKILEKEKFDKNEITEEPSVFKFLNNLDIILICSALALSVVTYTFYFPCLTNHLNEKYHLSVSMASLFFSVPVVSYLIVVNLINIISKKLGNLGSISAGILANIIGIYLIYPLPPFPKHIVFIIIGLALIGAGSLIFIFTLLELSNILKKVCKDYDQNTINDISSAINNLFTSLGDLLGPIIGGFLSSHFSFEISCIIIFSIFSIFFILFILLYNKNNKNESEKISNNNKEILQETLAK